MTSLANSDLALAPQSSEDFDGRVTQSPPEISASTNHTPRPCTPTYFENDDLALASRLLFSDDFDEQVAAPHRTGFFSTSEKACSSTPPNESDASDLGLPLNLSQLAADTSDERGSELDRQREFRTAIVDSLAFLLVVMSLSKVRTTSSLYLGDH